MGADQFREEMSRKATGPLGLAVEKVPSIRRKPDAHDLGSLIPVVSHHIGPPKLRITLTTLSLSVTG
jgi:hypothetical protein